MKKRVVVISLIVIVLIVTWYAFRPERLVVNKRADETVPAASAGSLAALASGPFHGCARDERNRHGIPGFEWKPDSSSFKFQHFEWPRCPRLHGGGRQCLRRRDCRARRLHRSGEHKRKYWRSGLYARARSGFVEISRRLHLVQTIQREFWNRAYEVS